MCSSEKIYSVGLRRHSYPSCVPLASCGSQNKRCIHELMHKRFCRISPHGETVLSFVVSNINSKCQNLWPGTQWIV